MNKLTDNTSHNYHIILSNANIISLEAMILRNEFIFLHITCINVHIDCPEIKCQIEFYLRYNDPSKTSIL